jgi:hypothetical protein
MSMQQQKFNETLEKRLNLCKNVLTAKATEYATEVRLHNFKVAAYLQNCKPTKALFGMFAKHIISLADMCISEKDYPIELWNEKIGDSINYLLLLNALVIEEKQTYCTNTKHTV